MSRLHWLVGGHLLIIYYIPGVGDTDTVTNSKGLDSGLEKLPI